MNILSNLVACLAIHKMADKRSNKVKAIAIGLCCGVTLSMPAMADDTEIYANSSAVDPSIQPNVLFLLDTSLSMGQPAQDVPPYDATEDYSDSVTYPTTVTACFDANTIYRMDNNGTKAKATAYCDAGGSQVWGRVLFSNFYCDNASIIDQNGGAGSQAEAVDSPGYYTGRVGHYVPGASSDSSRWQQFNNTSTQVVECKADRGVHGKTAGDAADYADKRANKIGDARWTADDTQAFNWDNLGTATVYTGNYLNYLIVTDVVDSYRIEIIRNAMLSFINSAANINLGFMPYSQRLVNSHSKGAMVEVAIDEINTTKAAIEQRLKVYGTHHDYTDPGYQNGHNNLVFGTPSARQYYEALRYFKGDAPVYGADSKAPPLAASFADDPDGTGPLTTSTSSVGFPSVANSKDWDGTYKSPVLNECQKNYVILLTDGLPYADSIAAGQLTEMGITDTSCTVDPSCVNGACDNSCLPLFAEAGARLSANDDLSLTEIQPISTYTIGFGLDPATSNGQIAIAALQGSSAISKSITGKGESFLANNADELKQHLITIVEALDTTATFSSPAVSVNAFNRSVHLNDLYFTLFKPASSPHWDGNIKKYKLAVRKDSAGDPVLDADGNKIAVIVDSKTPTAEEAIDPATGFFDDEARSYWTTTPENDGADVTKGGAINGFETRVAARNIYTYTGTYTTTGGVMVPADSTIIQSDNKVEASNTANITDTMLAIDGAANIQDGLGNTVLYHEALLDWAAGIDVTDSDGEGDIDDPRAVMGDPLHSQPGLVQYGLSGGNPDLVAYVATNDGYLHAIDPDSGEELWAFIPQELLPLLNTNFENVEGGAKGYGLDGDVVAWVDDVGNDGTITAGTDKVILYIGQRRGGNYIYALDVTNRSAPALLWIIKGGASGSPYEELGQTWSTVNVEQVKDNGNSKTVLIFGGGYDTRHDNDDVAVLPRVAPSSPLDPARDDSVGRTVFIADATTGVRLWSAGKGSASPTANMDYSIPARVKPLDMSGDGNVDRLYVADLGGQIFRFDINEASLAAANFSAAAISGGRLANLAVNGSLADARRFYYPPDVAIVAQKGKAAYLGLAISSGYRAHPNNKDIHDRIYLLKDRDIYNLPDYSTNPHLPLTEAKLHDATTNLASLPDNPTQAQIDASSLELADFDDKEGWYIDLDDEAATPAFVGEKGLAEPLIVEGSIIITTFVPETGVGVSSCEPKAGNGKVFYLDIVDATASYPSNLDTREDRHRDLIKGGIPASPNVIITEDGVPTTCIGTECESLGGDIGLRRTFWYEVEK